MKKIVANNVEGAKLRKCDEVRGQKSEVRKSESPEAYTAEELYRLLKIDLK